MSEDHSPVLAIYDFKHKQEFIYRTNRMQEITGASELIAKMFSAFLAETSEGKRIRNDWRSPDALPVFEGEELNLTEEEIGAVVYEGGGSMLVLYRSIEDYRNANKDFSKLVVDKAYSIDLIAAGVEWKEGETFNDVRDRLVNDAMDCAKRKGGTSAACNVLPYTLVDRVTFQPIVLREDSREFTAESNLKQKAYNRLKSDRKDENRFIDDIGTKKDEESLITVIYCDGNSIGERLKAATVGLLSPGEQVQAMREFSVGLREDLLVKPENSMKAAVDLLQVDEYKGYRVIVDHGDEITFICNAHAAPFVLEAYFREIEKAGYSACAGMAFCLTHAPFSEVYRIAEACCENGKERNRKEQTQDCPSSNFVDFQYVRAGITGSLKRIRAAHEPGLVSRPYRLNEYKAFVDVGRELSRSGCLIKRQDLKALNRAILRGDSWYRIELARLEAKDASTIQRVRSIVADALDSSSLGFGTDGSRDYKYVLRNVLFDVTSFWDMFDLFFKTGGEATAADISENVTAVAGDRAGVLS